ncbi:MAG: Cys-tRNA(Pro) deacylase [Lachnospiraceae bacterium]|nr:Cys-tRNA(Pro) deacylase [Candidatus Darwinimomas equi]
MADKKEKTNVMRVLDAAKISYEEFTYGSDVGTVGVEVARALGQDETHVYKTLVTTGKTGRHYVFVIPVAEELDLKKAASTVGEKSIEMLKSKDLLGLTGYIHGGCSPIGMKKFFRTVLHETAAAQDYIMFSGGRIGFQVRMNPKDLEKVIRIEYANLIKEQ